MTTHCFIKSLCLAAALLLAGAGPWSVAGEGAVDPADVSPIGPDQAAEHAQQGALARPAAAQDDADLSPNEAAGQAAEDLAAAPLQVDPISRDSELMARQAVESP